MYVCLSISRYVHITAGTYRGQGCHTALDLELEEVVNCLSWVLGSKLSCSVRAVHALNCWAISLAPSFLIMYFSLLYRCIWHRARNVCMACLGKPWENFVQLLLFDHFYEGSRYLTQVIGFAWQAFDLLNYEITKAYINRARAKNRHRNREKKSLSRNSRKWLQCS